VVQSASSRRNGPLSGTILSISPDTLTDELSGRQYYAVKIRLDDDRAEVVPGLPVEVFFKTGSQTPFEILTFPLARFFDSALREG
jgi:HlyD family secretion protein